MAKKIVVYLSHDKKMVVELTTPPVARLYQKKDDRKGSGLGGWMVLSTNEWWEEIKNSSLKVEIEDQEDN